MIYVVTNKGEKDWGRVYSRKGEAKACLLRMTKYDVMKGIIGNEWGISEITTTDTERLDKMSRELPMIEGKKEKK